MFLYITISESLGEKAITIEYKKKKKGRLSSSSRVREKERKEKIKEKKKGIGVLDQKEHISWIAFCPHLKILLVVPTTS